MLRILSSELFYTAYVNLPNMDTPPSWKIYLNPTMWPFFECALGVLDGTHILCSPLLYNQSSYQNWKGFMSQNCLFACHFDFQFVFGYTGWEWSATGVQVLEAGLKAGFDILDSYYYLADASYPPMSKHILTPFCGVQYHLAKWSWAEQKWVIQHLCPIPTNSPFQAMHEEGVIQSLTCLCMQCDWADFWSLEAQISDSAYHLWIQPRDLGLYFSCTGHSSQFYSSPWTWRRWDHQ